MTINLNQNFYKISDEKTRKLKVSLNQRETYKDISATLKLIKSFIKII